MPNFISWSEDTDLYINPASVLAQEILFNQRFYAKARISRSEHEHNTAYGSLLPSCPAFSLT